MDNDYFGRQRAALLPQRPSIRQQFGLPADAVVFLYAGQLAPEKRLPDLLHVVRALDDARAWLVLAGEGRERRHLENLARSIGLRQILFPGFKSQGGLARFYVAADAFVLPSGNETWGVVVNEAMNFALPVVVSDAAGAVPDLVEEGGFGRKGVGEQPYPHGSDGWEMLSRNASGGKRWPLLTPRASVLD